MVPGSTRRSTPALASTLPKCLVSPRNSTAAVVFVAITAAVSEFESRESMLLSSPTVVARASRPYPSAFVLNRRPACSPPLSEFDIQFKLAGLLDKGHVTHPVI